MFVGARAVSRQVGIQGNVSDAGICRIWAVQRVSLGTADDIALREAVDAAAEIVPHTYGKGEMEDQHINSLGNNYHSYTYRWDRKTHPELSKNIDSIIVAAAVK
jgi:hypothetical protein